MRPTHVELRSHRAAVWLALLVTFLWSTSWVLIRWGLDEEGLTPVMFAALRYGIAAIVLIAFVIVRERHGRHRYRVDARFVAMLVLLGVADGCEVDGGAARRPGTRYTCTAPCARP